MRHAAVIACALLLASALHAQEKITLTEPVHTDPGAAEFRLMTLALNANQWEVHATFGEVAAGTFAFLPNGKTMDCHYLGPDAEVLLKQLNTMNFSTVSMQKRVIQQCQKDGKIGAGTITGTPSPPTVPPPMPLPPPPPGKKPCNTPPCI
jgi:hypothetical protein